MRLFLDPRLLRIESIRTLNKFFEGDETVNIKPIEEGPNYYNISDIIATSNRIDKVRDFVEYYITVIEQKEPLAGRVQYIVNRLYAAKGYTEIFSILEEQLSFKVTPVFQGSFLVKLQYEDVISNYFDFINQKLIDALFYLILINDVRSFVKHLMLNISETLDVKQSRLSRDFSILNITIQ